MESRNLLLSRPYRPDIKATKQADGSVIIRAGRAYLQLDAADLHELYAYAADRPTIQRFLMAPKMPLEATQSGD